jgi:hypothetical protein
MAKKVWLIVFVISFCFTVSNDLLGQAKPALKKGQTRGKSHLAKLFRDDNILKMEIRGPISKIRHDRGSKKRYHPAQLRYFDKYRQKQVMLTVQIRTRGRFRRNPRNCNFPPLKIKFARAELKGTLFAKQDNLKLVTQCQTNRTVYEQYIFGEYLVYKLYSLFTRRSLAVRLAHITYNEPGKKSFTRYGFFIEKDSRMGQRNGMKPIEYKKGQNYIINLQQRSQLAVFQFMVGNTDWAKFSDHNIIFYKPARRRALISVPYDFDFCGIVNAHYAGPAPESGIKSFQDRVFQGYCRSKGEFQLLFNRFRAKRQQVLSLYQDFRLLTPEYRTYALKYLQKFFEILDNPRLVKKYFYDGCRKIR